MPVLKLCLCSSRTATHLLVLCFLLLHVHAHHATAVSFEYNYFSSDDFRAEDDARVTAGRIELLGDQAGACRARGRALYRQAVQLWDRLTGEAAGFTASFNFSIQSVPGRSSTPGHGMTFFLAPYTPDIPQESYDGCLGLFDESLVPKHAATTIFPNASGDARFVAVEFDTHRDAWDPSSRHIGVDVNNVYSGGNYKILPDASLVDAGVMSATVNYDNATTRLNVVLSVSGATYSLAATVDLRSILPEQVSVGFSAATGDTFGSNHTVLSCSFKSTLPTRNDTSLSLPSTSSTKKDTVQLSAGVAAAASLLVLLFGVIVAVFLRRASRKNRPLDDKDMLAGDMTPDSLDIDNDDEFGSSTGPRPIQYADLAAATGNFPEDGKLGQGGSGSVYRGHMKQLGGRDVAIKVFLRGASTDGRKEYRSEVTIISRLRHRNLVQLIGWCHGRRRLLLVYELVHNGSLDGYLYSKEETALTWQVRYQIILGLASAVLYLHQEWDQCVVHGDIKPSNIMLDESFNAKLGDFGLARLIDHGVSLQTLTAMAGTPGYLDPECVITGKASTESDVYSFGVTLLEIACGRRPMARPSAGAKEDQVFRLLEWAWDLYGRGAALDAADARLGGAFDRWEMERVVTVGLWSAHPDPKMRPTIRQAAEALQSRKFRMPVLPPQMPVAVYLQPFAASTMEYSDSMTTVGSGDTMDHSSTATQSSNSSVPAAVTEQLSPRV